MNKSYLKWAGSKYRMLDDLIPLIHSFKDTKNKDQTFIEPFVGSATVFLNVTEYDNYILNDLNADIYMLLNQIKNNPKILIDDINQLIINENNNKEKFKEYVEIFNKTKDYYERCKIFIYLNRHCFNGLMRFNKSGKYNTPFGRYPKPYNPEKEILLMNKKLNENKVELFNYSFERIFDNINYGDVIYCDPPYVSNFTQYNSESFTYQHQEELRNKAESAIIKGATTIISNSYNDITKELYKNCSEYYIKKVRRSIAAKGGDRKEAEEIIAIYR